MKAKYYDAEHYSVELPDGTVVPRLFTFDWERLGVDKLEKEGLIEEYTEPEVMVLSEDLEG